MAATSVHLTVKVLSLQLSLHAVYSACVAQASVVQKRRVVKQYDIYIYIYMYMYESIDLCLFIYIYIYI